MRDFHIPVYEEMIAEQNRHRAEGLLALTHYIEVNKGSMKHPRWVRHSEYPTRHDAEQAMFRSTLAMPASKKRVSNADQTQTVMIAIYAADPVKPDE